MSSSQPVSQPVSQSDADAPIVVPHAHAPDAAVVGAEVRLRWFVTLWVMALAFHYSDSDPLAVLPVLVFALPALAYPCVATFLPFLAVDAVLAALHLPAASNHLVLSLLVAVALGGAALHAWWRPGPEPFAARWLDTARTPGGLVLLVVYAFTVFHKLNTAFFDPAVSCAGSLLAQLVSLSGGTPAFAPALVSAAAAGTVVVEAAVLLLLAVPGWQRWGVVLGVGLHAVLAPASFFDFATVVFALYVLLMPREVFAGLATREARLRGVALAAFGIHVLVGLVTAALGISGPTVHLLLVGSWYVAVGTLMVPAVLAGLATRVPWPRWRRRPAVLLLVPLVAFANGATSYLGLKTVANYSMFSNLHTEQGATNHVVPGIAALDVAGFARDTVTVTALRLPDRAVLDPVTTLLGGGSYVRRAARWSTEPVPVVVPYQELRRTVLLWRDAGIRGVTLTYTHEGVARTVADATADPELSAPLPWWERHLLAFRAVDSADGPDRCRW
ncbi:MAG: hypothetical protein AB7J32_13235 [Pseudonocardia sp.]